MAKILDGMKVFFGFQEEDMENRKTESVRVEETIKAPVVKTIYSTSTPKMISEIRVEEPRIYEDSLNIASYLRENKPVIINLKNLDGATGKRLIDFICGTTYAINGKMKKIGENIFLFTPASVLITEPEQNISLDSKKEKPKEDNKLFFEN